MHRLFVVCAPGLEKVLSREMGAGSAAGGVEKEGDLREAARLNLTLRTATRVLLRLGELRATTFAELVRKAQKLPFDLCLRKGDPVAPLPYGKLWPAPRSRTKPWRLARRRRRASPFRAR
jgi:putative N6-adenine-specific DNA methylase